MPRPTAAKPRNRSAESRKRGRLMRAFEMLPETDHAIDCAAAALRASLGGATRTQALEWLIRHGAKSIPESHISTRLKRFLEKSEKGLDPD